MEPNTPARRASVTGLAIVGFIALLVLGLVLALWAARSLTGNGGLGGVGDYVNSMFANGTSSTLAVVPNTTSSTTISFNEDRSSGSGSVASTSIPTKTESTTKPAKRTGYAQGSYPVYYRTVTTTYPVPGATRIAVNSNTTKPVTSYYGSPDLAVKISSIGYFDSNNNFVATSSVPLDATLGAQMVVTNNGTDKTGPWEITVTVPTLIDNAFFYNQKMDSLEPGQPTLITMRLDVGHPRKGTNYMSVKLDPDNKISESNESNNEDSFPITGY